MSEKFSSPLAEELYECTLESFQDDDLGDAETFGWFALFREGGAILSCDSRGFVSVETPDDVSARWMELSDRWEWFQFSHLNESCDGLFLILDTARHGGWVPDFEEVGRHIDTCDTCQSLGNELSE